MQFVWLRHILVDTFSHKALHNHVSYHKLLLPHCFPPPSNYLHHHYHLQIKTPKFVKKQICLN
ncbi:uncharacterized protein BX663DRAFT_172169 [Cokeromyces recurvatus]|uniref:uncharacterized protein n=1 Tax=Cokeromyces recurvatus TaxID=90255 RepID=UPI00222099F6|nr:uncharacterized protein BX663DRAFT_172169 [Cokeromyces recurvatus]KAI7900008.1 hypothetical protein BX663DRAFT_172169 [Cokeromyces recurvatus]